MKLFYSDTFVLPLPPGHRFPMAKYALLRERLMSDPGMRRHGFHVPDPASDRALSRVHTKDYLDHLRQGTLPVDISRRIGFPWSPQMVERSRRSVGATMAAADAALADGVGVNLAGGTHHAFADRGGGYCVLNDTVVAARWLQASGRVEQVLVVDLDVHQGDGTADLCAGDPSIFTLSIHGEKNYPARKPPSDLDVALPDDTTDEVYLEALDRALAVALDRVRPELVFYLAGADPYVHDRLGRLALTKTGLRERDRRVFETFAARRVPVCLTMAGGYAESVQDVVDIHAASVQEAARNCR